eukprot:6214818-Pleurochrysis_carterae.AAC.7
MDDRLLGKVRNTGKRRRRHKKRGTQREAKGGSKLESERDAGGKRGGASEREGGREGVANESERGGGAGCREGRWKQIRKDRGKTQQAADTAQTISRAGRREKELSRRRRNKEMACSRFHA